MAEAVPVVATTPPRVHRIELDRPWSWLAAGWRDLCRAPAVSLAYGVLFPNFGSGMGDTAARAAFVIGQDGVVKYAEQTPTPKDLPNFAAVKAALAK